MGAGLRGTQLALGLSKNTKAFVERMHASGARILGWKSPKGGYTSVDEWDAAERYLTQLRERELGEGVPESERCRRRETGHRG